MVYLDNGSTSFPKPEYVLKKTFKAVSENYGSSMRSSSTENNDIIYETRKKLAKLMNVPFASNVIFTSNSTEALNAIINGFLNEGDRVISTAIEHNSVVRPLAKLRKSKHIKTNWVKCDGKGLVDPDEMINLIKEKKPKLVIMNHASNITGKVQNVEKVGNFIDKLPNTYFLVDASQSLGHIPFDNEKIKADFIAFTGHKALLGFSGIGGYYIKPNIQIEPLKVGGTGVLSELVCQPAGGPVHYECGTQNIVGITSLYYSLDFLNELNVENVKKELLEKTEYLISKLNHFSDVNVYSEKNPVGIVSFNIKGIVPSRLSTILSENYNIVTCAGLICAPFIHEFLGSNPFGIIRASVSHFTSKEDMDQLINAIEDILTNIDNMRNINFPQEYVNPSIYDYCD